MVSTGTRIPTLSTGTRAIPHLPTSWAPAGLRPCARNDSGGTVAGVLHVPLRDTCTTLSTGTAYARAGAPTLSPWYLGIRDSTSTAVPPTRTIYGVMGGPSRTANIVRNARRCFDHGAPTKRASFCACTISGSFSSGSSRGSSVPTSTSCAEGDRATSWSSRPSFGALRSESGRASRRGVASPPGPKCSATSTFSAGSAAETEHHLVTWQDIGGIDARECEKLLARVTSIRRMLFSLMRNLPE